MIDVAATDALLTTTRAVRRRLDLDRPVRAVRCNLLEEPQEQALAGGAPARHLPLSLGPFEIVTLRLMT